MEVLKHGNQKSLNKPSKSKKGRSSGRVLVDDLWIVDNISKFVCLFIYWASVCTVTLMLTTYTQRGHQGRSLGRILGDDLWS